MDFNTCVKGRRSIRKFTDEAVSREDIEKLVELASCAPSWKNTQVPRYIVVEDPALIKKIAEDCVLGFAYNSATLLNAPAVIVMTVVKERSGYERDGSYSTSKEDRWEMFDAGVAAQTLSLAAHAAGLGTVIMGVFDEDRLCATVDVPESQKAAALIAIGHAAEAPSMPKRKSVEELLSFR